MTDASESVRLPVVDQKLHRPTVAISRDQPCVCATTSVNECNVPGRRHRTRGRSYTEWSPANLRDPSTSTDRQHRRRSACTYRFSIIYIDRKHTPISAADIDWSHKSVDWRLTNRSRTLVVRRSGRSGDKMKTAAVTAAAAAGAATAVAAATGTNAADGTWFSVRESFEAAVEGCSRRD